jgi:hypothetical protein
MKPPVRVTGAFVCHMMRCDSVGASKHSRTHRSRQSTLRAARFNAEQPSSASSIDRRLWQGQPMQ